MTTRNSTYIQFRNAVHLPLVPDTAVQLVTDDSVCARAVATWRTQDTSYAKLERLYVIRLGASGMYDTVDPSGPGSEWSQHILLDSLFKRVDVYLY